VFYRDEDGRVNCVARDALPGLAATGAVTEETAVFDTGLTTAGAWRDRFESPARATWVSRLLRV
jgi:hypothetical protein